LGHRKFLSLRAERSNLAPPGLKLIEIASSRRSSQRRVGMMRGSPGHRRVLDQDAKKTALRIGWRNRFDWAYSMLRSRLRDILRGEVAHGSA